MKSYNYPVNEIQIAREDGDIQMLHRLKKEYKRLHQGVTRMGMWHTESEEEALAMSMGVIFYTDSQMQRIHLNKNDRRIRK